MWYKNFYYQIDYNLCHWSQFWDEEEDNFYLDSINVEGGSKMYENLENIQMISIFLTCSAANVLCEK